MNRISLQMCMVLFLFPLLLFTGCKEGIGAGRSEHTLPLQQQSGTLSTTITKGNYVEVAKFVYGRSVAGNVSNIKMDVLLPGKVERGIPKKDVYTVNTIYGSSAKLRKIVIKNHQDRLEIKFMKRDTVSIILQMPGESIETNMALHDFITNVTEI